MEKQKKTGIKESFLATEVFWQNLRENVRDIRTKDGAPEPDIYVGIHENTMNDFLAAHYDANPEFYNRTDLKTPIWQTTVAVENGEPERFMKIYGKVVLDEHKKPVTIDLSPTPDENKEYAAWYRNTFKMNPKGIQIPPNIIIKARILLIFNFTDRSNPQGPGHVLDYQFDTKIGAFLTLAYETNGTPYVQATNFAIHINSLGIDQKGNKVPSAGYRISALTKGKDSDCEAKLKDLRNKITDLFDFGAHYAISKLAANLTARLPVPPFVNIVNGISVGLDYLTIQDNTIAVGGYVSHTRADISESLHDGYIAQTNKVPGFFSEDTLTKIALNAPRDPKKLIAWMRTNIPGFNVLDDEFNKNMKNMKSEVTKTSPTLPTNADIFALTNGAIFDALAKKYLRFFKQDCSRVLEIGVGLYDARIDCCWRGELKNASGGIRPGNDPYNDIFMGADVDLAGWLRSVLSAVNPSGADPELSYDIGMGLKGPLKISLRLDTKKIEANATNTYFLEAHFKIDAFPGVYLIGLPQILEEIVNCLLEAVTAFLFRAILNAIVEQIHFYLFKIVAKVPHTNVKIIVSNPKVSTAAGFMTLGVDAKFKKA